MNIEIVKEKLNPNDIKSLLYWQKELNLKMEEYDKEDEIPNDDLLDFNSMIKSCMKGEIDMIITKSISRFARNTVDCLNYIRKLKEKNIPVFFEKESINTMDSKGEVLLTIMASLAQQESQSLSQNVKLGFQFRFKQGKISVKYHIINDIVWAYDSSGVQSKKKYGSLYEPILMAAKSDKTKYTFNHEDILVEAKTGAKRGLIDYRKNPPQPYNTQKVPGNVWEFPRVRYKMDEYENHPSQKPEALLERIIKASSNLGDVVLDPFGGSFFTGAVAVRLGRKIISMDINKEYFKIGIRRTGIATKYEGEILQKDKSRKTKNTSKKDHQQNQDGQMSLLIE